jgi:hypothetical protein
MMVNYLLCKSELFQRTATAVVDMLGGVGESFLGQCSPKVQLPHLILHGMEDSVITYWKDNVVDGSNFISTREYSCCNSCSWLIKSVRQPLDLSSKADLRSDVCSSRS